MFRMSYTTPQAVYRQLEMADSALVTNAALAEYANATAIITEYCYQASAWISRYTSTYFAPYRYPYPYYTYDEALQRQAARGVLVLPDYCLYVNEVTQNGVVVNPIYYRLDPPTLTPATTLRLLPTYSWLGNLYVDNVIEVNGLFGYVTDYANAYTTIETIAGTITASQTTITVVDAELYEVLQYLRLDSELVQITAINTATDVLTIKRGVNGTTAATHSAFDVERFNPDDGMALAATRMVAYMYQKRNDVGSAVQTGGSSVTIDAMPVFVQETLDSYRRAVIRAV